MPRLKNKQFAEKDNQDFPLARDFGDECLQYTTGPGEPNRTGFQIIGNGVVHGRRCSSTSVPEAVATGRRLTIGWSVSIDIEVRVEFALGVYFWTNLRSSIDQIYVEKSIINRHDG